MPRRKGYGTHHVVPNPDGGWDVRRGGAKRASAHFKTKREATAYGHEFSRNGETELKIHNRNGRISQSDSHGNDPRDIKG